MTDTPNLWHGVPFNAGDTVLLEWKGDYTGAIGRAVWVVPEHHVVEDPDFAELSDDNEEMGGLGLVLNGDENIHPDTLTVIAADASPISLDGYAEVSIYDLEEGDAIIVVTADGELVAEHTLTDLSIEGYDDGQLYDVLGFGFDEDFATVYRKVT